MITQTETQQHPAVTTYNHHLQQRYKELEAFVRWEDDLFSNRHISGNHKLEIRATRRAVKHAQTRDEQGRARINLTTIAEQIGISPDTMSRGLKVLEQCGVIADHDIKPELQENGERWTRHYVALNEELLQQPKEIKPPAPRNHGGQRYTCQKCGSDQVKIRKHITLVCKCCKHESLIEESEHDQEPTTLEQAGNHDANCDNEQGRNLQDILKPVTPPNVADCGDQGDPEDKKQDAAQDDLDLRAAADLLLALAGQANEHIEMSRSGAKKYYTVDRPLTINDLVDHLRGGKARGAECRYPDDQARGLCWDKDDEEGWQLLEHAAGQLVQAGYFPILDKSPAGRGGHLWIIFDDLVNVSAARRHVYSITPELEDIVEYWPGPQDAKRWNRVRLPGARYVRPGVAAWCQLISAADGVSSTDGRSAATLLLSHQTPASIVPELASQDLVSPAALLAEMLGNNDQNSEMLPNMSQEPEAPVSAGVAPLPEVDAAWIAKHGPIETTTLWFAVTDVYAAAWYNEHHSLEEIRPRERNGMALSPNGNERTASTSYRDTPQGERYTDHSLHGRRPDGTHDTGDALELASKVQQRPKSALLSETTKEISSQARAEMERAASTGQPMPSWVEDILTPAGRCRYAHLVAAQGGAIQAKRHVTLSTSAIRNENMLRIDVQVSSDEPKIAETSVSANHQAPVAPISEQSGGVTGFLFSQGSDQASKVEGVQEGLRGSAVAVPASFIQGIAVLEVIRDYGQGRQWEALVIDGEEIISAGRSKWLYFVWLSHGQEQQRRAYEYITRQTATC